MTSKQAYVLNKGYTDNSIKGISGALAGKNATIKSHTYKDGVNTIIFGWTADDGTTRETKIEVRQKEGAYRPARTQEPKQKKSYHCWGQYERKR